MRKGSISNISKGKRLQHWHVMWWNNLNYYQARTWAFNNILNYEFSPYKRRKVKCLETKDLHLSVVTCIVRWIVNHLLMVLLCFLLFSLWLLFVFVVKSMNEASFMTLELMHSEEFDFLVYIYYLYTLISSTILSQWIAILIS